ncbi:MAG: hypothetical protein PHH58_09885 [Rhodoferax sp.]|nr:hypothetical protein [Rhodoferax sp.]
MGANTVRVNGRIDARRGDWVRRMRFWGESTRGDMPSYAKAQGARISPQSPVT